MKKYIWIFLMIALLAAFCCACENQEENYDQQAVRLHIVANSDSETDQKIKLDLRDELLQRYSTRFAALDNAETVWNALEDLSTEIQATANDLLQQWGLNYTADTALGIYEFPDRNYAGKIYPAGMYRALKVVLGEGQGQNWWCVLYPPLCMLSDVDSGEYYAQAEQYLSGAEEARPEAAYRFWLLDKLGLGESWDAFMLRLSQRFLQNIK